MHLDILEVVQHNVTGIVGSAYDTKNMLLGKMKYLILFLIAIQSVLLALMAIFLQVFSMRRHGKVITVILGQLQFIFKDYLKNRRKVYTNTFGTK